MPRTYFVQLHGSVECLPIECSYLSTDSPKGARIEIAREDTGAFGIDSHEMVSVVLGNCCGVLGKEFRHAGFGHVDEVMMRAIAQVSCQP